MGKSRPVLILAGTSRVVVAIARCLDRHGIEVDVAVPEAPGQVRIASRSIRNVHQLKSFAATEQVFEAVNGLVDKYGYDMLIPTTDESLIGIAPLYEGLQRRLYPGCPKPEIVKTVLDKRLTLDAAQKCGISVPLEYRLRTVAELGTSRDALRFPLVAKPVSKIEEFNFALQYFHTYDQLHAAFLVDPFFGSRHVLQEYCPGYGVGVEILMWDGKIQAVFQHRRLKESPHTGGVGVLVEAQSPNAELVEISARLLRQLNWQGVAMVEFRYDPRTNRAAFMEVNGRYWGSLPVSVNTGIEFPFYEWQLAHGCQEVGPVPAYAPGFRTIWRVGDALRFLSVVAGWKSGRESFQLVRKEAGALIVDCCLPIPDALWRWNDAKPALLELLDRIVRPALSAGTLLKILPAGIAHSAKIYRYHGLRLGLRHTYLSVLSTLRSRRRSIKLLARDSRSFLFVCSGNIMRSPMAAALLKEQLKNLAIRIESAGLFASAGRRADPAAAAASRDLSISLDDHVSSLVTAEMVAQADIIFVMDHLNEAVLLNRFPRAAHKTFLLGACSSVNGRRIPEIRDPYQQGLTAARKCSLEIQECIRNLGEWITESSSLPSVAKPVAERSGS